MKAWHYSLCILILMLSACGANPNMPLKEQSAVQALYGSSLTGLTAAQTEQGMILELTQLAESGLFLRVEPPRGMGLGQATWHGVEDVLTLAAESEQGVDVGLVPLSEYAGAEIKLVLNWGGSTKRASRAPMGDSNKLIDLALLDLGSGEVQLSWTQMNLGDYDLNGEVNISDLSPIGMYFGMSEAGDPASPVYWVDGDQNGEINIADITPIGSNYTSSVAGYNVRRNGSQAVILSSGDAISGNYPPPFYEVTLAGLATDTWTVAPFDGAGVEGIETVLDNVIEPPPVDVQVEYTIVGQQLLDLTDGSDPGPLDDGSGFLRIIDPIEIIDALSVGTVISTGVGQATGHELPRDQQLAVQIGYAPAVDLATGAPKSGTGLRGVSAAPEPLLNTIVFELPPGTEAAGIIADIDIGTPNPAGGFFTDLHTEITLPGDNPATPAVETSYTLIVDTRLDNFNSLVSRDTDGNGAYDDEAWLEDDDLDCLSERMRDQELDDDRYEDDERNELEISGTVLAFDEAQGTITLTGAVLEMGELETPLADPLLLVFSENTEFIERIKQPGDDIEQDVDPSTFAPNDEVEVELYRLDDTELLLPEKYWIEKIRREIDLDPGD